MNNFDKLVADVATAEEKGEMISVDVVGNGFTVRNEFVPYDVVLNDDDLEFTQPGKGERGRVTISSDFQIEYVPSEKCYQVFAGQSCIYVQL